MTYLLVLRKPGESRHPLYKQFLDSLDPDSTDLFTGNCGYVGDLEFNLNLRFRPDLRRKSHLIGTNNSATTNLEYFSRRNNTICTPIVGIARVVLMFEGQTAWSWLFTKPTVKILGEDQPLPQAIRTYQGLAEEEPERILHQTIRWRSNLMDALRNRCDELLPLKLAIGLETANGNYLIDTTKDLEINNYSK